MQLQLSMAVADKLHEALLVRGEPLDATDAACLLMACPSCPPPLCRQVLGALVDNDHRFYLIPKHGGDAESSAMGPAVDTLGRVSLRTWEIPDPDLADIPFVALDLETTGARPGANKITEIGAVRFEGFREVGRFSTLVNPMRPIPPMITQITGITQEMVAEAPRIEEVIPELVQFLRGGIIVAHNAGFDVGFLNYELRRLKGRQLGEGAIDTLPLARALAPGLPNYRLGTLADSLGAPVAACHRALADAEAVGHVFITLIGRLQEQGVTRLSGLRSFCGPQSRSAVEKLRLTRDIPKTPGAYHFVDKDGQILYVGKADRLRERVRSHFVANATPPRKVRQAIRLVERIEWDETLTPLEAVVKEQELILEHRPPCNMHGSRPENYTYVKLSESKLGFQLLRTTRGPAPPLEDGSGTRSRAGRAVLIGPFRGRSRLFTALDLLAKSYPIRRCPRRPDGRPCVRGDTGRCLAPCGEDVAVRGEHDALVRGILDWLAGGNGSAIPDPEERMAELTRTLSRQRRYEEAQRVRDAWEDLLSIRRSYASLVEARTLSFASLWPLEDGDGTPEARLNLVWRGRLHRQVTLHRDSLEDHIDEVFASLDDEPLRVDGETGHPRYIAVPQTELDTILAIRRWFMEASAPATIMFDGDHGDDAAAGLANWRNQVRDEALRLL